MPDIKQRELKMQEKRKQTPFHDFVKEICSRYPLIFHKNNNLISRYSKNVQRVGDVLESKKYQENRELFIQSGIEYRPNESFFDNFKRLQQRTPVSHMVFFTENENSDYADNISNSKNCYLSFHVISGCENILYSNNVKQGSKNVYNSNMVRNNSENIYMSCGVIQGFNVFYSRYITNSSNIWFSSNLIGCHDCILCDNLENTSYCINNKQYEKENYLKEAKKIFEQKDNFLSLFSQIDIKGNNIGSQNATGQFDVQCADISNAYLCNNVKGGNNLILVGGINGDENMFDGIGGGSPKAQNYYGFLAVGVNSNDIYNSTGIVNSSNLYYCDLLESCSYCLGCIGLKNKSFCILNKQYTKEERFELANKIFAQMERDGSLGAFFPGWINPFYFNDTVAYLVDDSFTKEEVMKAGYLRRDEEIKVDVPTNAEVITTKDLVQYEGFNNKGEREIDKDILKKVIQDDKGNYYRIVPMELEFLQKHGLPLPEIHRLERIKLGFKFK